MRRLPFPDDEHDPIQQRRAWRMDSRDRKIADLGALKSKIETQGLKD
jgi:hypothetical protein